MTTKLQLECKIRRWRQAITLFASLSIFAGLLLPRGSAANSFRSWANHQASRYLDPETELQTGINLTKQGRFTEAIPHFLGAQGRVRDEFAADFNLALCYVATGQPVPAVKILQSLKEGGNGTGEVNNLLAQAYIGAGQDKEALSVFQQAVAQAPKDEKLYLFLSDACMDHQSYDLGLQILDEGLRHLPDSARLHYERGVFFSLESLPDSALRDYGAASKLAPDTEIAYMAAGQAALLQGNISEAVRITHEGVRAGYQNYILLALFGSAVASSGAEPREPVFAEAQAALEKSIAEHPSYEGSHLALAKLDLQVNRLDDAIEHLEIARKLAPADPSVYSHLGVAYRRKGNLAKAQEVLATLAKLDATQAAKYKTDSPNRAGYVATGHAPRKPQRD